MSDLNRLHNNETQREKRDLDYNLVREILSSTPVGFTAFKKLWKYLMDLDISQDTRDKLIEKSENLVVNILVLGLAHENGDSYTVDWRNEEDKVYDILDSVGLSKHFPDALLIIEDSFGKTSTMNHRERVMNILDNK